MDDLPTLHRDVVGRVMYWRARKQFRPHDYVAEFHNYGASVRCVHCGQPFTGNDLARPPEFWLDRRMSEK